MNPTNTEVQFDVTDAPRAEETARAIVAQHAAIEELSAEHAAEAESLDDYLANLALEHARFSADVIAELEARRKLRLLEESERRFDLRLAEQCRSSEEIDALAVHCIRAVTEGTAARSAMQHVLRNPLSALVMAAQDSDDELLLEAVRKLRAVVEAIC